MKVKTLRMEMRLLSKSEVEASRKRKAALCAWMQGGENIVGEPVEGKRSLPQSSAAAHHTQSTQ